MSKVKVTNIELHDGFFIPGLLSDQGGGQFNKSIPSNKTLLGLEMYRLNDGSVDVIWGAKEKRQAINIGAANVKYVKYATLPIESA